MSKIHNDWCATQSQVFGPESLYARCNCTAGMAMDYVPEDKPREDKPPKEWNAYADITQEVIKGLTDSVDKDMMRMFHTSETGGTKEVKLAQFGLIPKEALWELAELYGKGAKKYGPWNWSKGYDYSLSFNAMMRHAWQWWSGEEIDEETGISHIICAAWHCFALFYFLNHYPQYDDRNKDEL